MNTKVNSKIKIKVKRLQLVYRSQSHNYEVLGDKFREFLVNIENVQRNADI